MVHPFLTHPSEDGRPAFSQGHLKPLFLDAHQLQGMAHLTVNFGAKNKGTRGAEMSTAKEDKKYRLSIPPETALQVQDTRRRLGNFSVNFNEMWQEGGPIPKMPIDQFKSIQVTCMMIRNQREVEEDGSVFSY